MVKNTEAVEVEDSKYSDWRVDDALRTFLQAEEIQKDEKLMKLVSEKAKVQKEALDKIELRKELFYGTGKDEKKCK